MGSVKRIFLLLPRILKIQSMGAACLYYILRQIANSPDDVELQAAFNVPTKRVTIQVEISSRANRELNKPTVT
jgi:hypothetical protein